MIPRKQSGKKKPDNGGRAGLLGLSSSAAQRSGRQGVRADPVVNISALLRAVSAAVPQATSAQRCRGRHSGEVVHEVLTVFESGEDDSDSVGSSSMCSSSSSDADSVTVVSFTARSGRNSDGGQRIVVVEEHVSATINCEETDEDEDDGLSFCFTVPFSAGARLRPGAPSRPSSAASSTRPKETLVPAMSRSHNFTVVVDLDETVVAARDPCRPPQVRPGTAELFAALRAVPGVEIIIWTAGISAMVRYILGQIDTAISNYFAENAEAGPKPSSWYDHVISRNSRWFHEAGPSVKDLEMLGGGRSVNKTLVLENNPASVCRQPHNAVLVEDYTGAEVEEGDRSLYIVSDLCKDIIAAVRKGRSVSQALRSHSSVQQLRFDVGYDLTANGAAESSLDSDGNFRCVGLKYSMPGGNRIYAGVGDLQLSREPQSSNDSATEKAATAQSCCERTPRSPRHLTGRGESGKDRVKVRRSHIRGLRKKGARRQ